MATVSIHMPENTGLTGFTLYLRKTSDGTLVNTGGDALTESPASSGRFTATVAEAWTETLAAVVLDGSSLAIRDGWLASGETIVQDSLNASLSTTVGNIQAKTDNLPPDPADQSAVEAAITAAASLLATAAELAKVPKAGETRRFTQIAANSGAKTADVSIGDPL